jgi:hypothetical protein
LGEHLSYATAMGVLAAIAMTLAFVVIGLGPEAKGVSFRRSGQA